MSDGKKTILVASRDPQHADVRREILEEAGFDVVSAMELRAVESACTQGKLAGVVIGFSLPPAEKRRVWQRVRELCGPQLPVLELLQGGEPELLQAHALSTHEWSAGRGFAKAVERILSGKPAEQRLRPRTESDFRSEYNEIAARMKRGTSPNSHLDAARLRELEAKIREKEQFSDDEIP